MLVLGATVGAAFIRSTRDAFFYQQFTPEIVMWACGRGLLNVVDKPAALLDFLFGRQPVFDCGALDLVRHTQAPGFFLKSQLYLDMVVGALWRVFGASYAALWPIFALLHGAYAAGCFALARLFYRLPLALGLGILATLSPVAVGMLFALRDYSKAPFFVWCIVLLLMALRAARPSQAILCGALAGLVVGIGTGFRSDTMMLAPIGALLPLIGSNAALSAWRVRMVTLAAFLGAAIAGASPILGLGGGGGFGTLIMQGATDPFDRFLGVTPGPYSLGWSYSDELTLSAVTAALRPGDPAWDAHEFRARGRQLASDNAVHRIFARLGRAVRGGFRDPRAEIRGLDRRICGAGSAEPPDARPGGGAASDRVVRKVARPALRSTCVPDASVVRRSGIAWLAASRFCAQPSGILGARRVAVRATDLSGDSVLD